MSDVIAYVAGILDGEGTISLTKQSQSSRFRHPHVSVSSTTTELMDFLLANFGGSVSKRKIGKLHYKQAYVWAISNDKALIFLEKVLPYLIVPEKCRRANLLVSEYKMVTPRNGKYTEDMFISKTDFEKRFLMWAK